MEKYSNIKVFKVKGDRTEYILYHRWIPRFLYDPEDVRSILELLPNLEIINIESITLRRPLFRKIAFMPKLQQLYIKLNCRGQQWNDDMQNTLKDLIQRLHKYKIWFWLPTKTIRAAVKNDFIVREELYGGGLILERF